jgi:hypothetical protein
MSRGTYAVRRCFSVAGFLFFCLPAHAADPEPTQDTPSFLPSGSNLASDTALSFERVTKRNLVPAVQTVGGAPPPSDPLLNYQYKKETGNIYQSLQYEVADSYVVTISDYCSLVSERYGYAGSGTYSNLHGRNCGDPALSGIFRALRQSDSEAFPVNLDIGAGFAPDLVKGGFYQPVIAAGTEVGDVNFAVSHVFDKASVLGRIGTQISGQASFKGGGGSEVLTARQQLYLDLVGQYRVWEDLPVTLGIRTVPSYSYTEHYRYYPSDPISPSIVQDNKYRGAYSFYPYIELSHSIIPDVLSASIRYQHGFEGDQKYYDQSNPNAFVGKVDKVGSDFIMIDFRVLWL